MKFTEKVKLLIESDEIKEASEDFLEDFINALMGDPFSAGKILITIAKSPFFIREQIFWNNFQAFLDGIYLEEDDCQKLSKKLQESGEKGDNPKRLLDCIYRAVTQQKIQYLINITRCLLADLFDLECYFRLCNSIICTLEEDLLFLKKHIEEDEFQYNASVQGLLTSGLMFQREIEESGEYKYSFNYIAKILDKYAFEYNENTAEEISEILISEEFVPKITLPLSEWEYMKEEDIDKIFSEEDIDKLKSQKK